MLEKARFPSQNGPLAYEDTESIIMGLRSVDILSSAIFWHSNILDFCLPSPPPEFDPGIGVLCQKIALDKISTLRNPIIIDSVSS